MKCNINIGLGIVSIILIISISILVLYKNMEDNAKDNAKDNIYENFGIQESLRLQNSLGNLVISNNNQINGLLNQLTAITPAIPIEDDPVAVNKEFQQSVAQSIASQTSDISDNYLKHNQLVTTTLTGLENTIIDLENMINNKKIKTINETRYNYVKSLNNGMEMNLFSTPNTVFQDKTTGKITNAYLVNVNDGCLSVGTNDYDVYKCNDKNPKQLFKMQHILNESEYEQNVDQSLPFNNVDKSAIKYPFAMIKSSNTNECLTNNHGNLTVQPCYSFLAQRWMPIE